MNPILPPVMMIAAECAENRQLNPAPGVQGGEPFKARLEESPGGAKNAHEWIALAHVVNREGCRAMPEA